MFEEVEEQKVIWSSRRSTEIDWRRNCKVYCNRWHDDWYWWRGWIENYQQEKTINQYVLKPKTKKIWWRWYELAISKSHRQRSLTNWATILRRIPEHKQPKIQQLLSALQQLNKTKGGNNQVPNSINFDIIWFIKGYYCY